MSFKQQLEKHICAFDRCNVSMCNGKGEEVRWKSLCGMYRVHARTVWKFSMSKEAKRKEELEGRKEGTVRVASLRMEQLAVLGVYIQIQTQRM